MPTTKSGLTCWASCVRAVVEHKTGESTSAAIATRSAASANGPNSGAPIRIKRKDAPQMAPTIARFGIFHFDLGLPESNPGALRAPECVKEDWIVPILFSDVQIQLIQFTIRRARLGCRALRHLGLVSRGFHAVFGF